ncbi:TylF/MycF family methyltransferase [Frankia sp. Cppng1_Ct_nod]|uniref:TylF/MycF family methyltransferase n=1 Tax=Frankia sp. Cppng1_Ct_nod TaxID=2897162 RepID=UPI0010417B23|nr:TylF/MycF family methyltransferase [Frankia sp. Cppng1_Ct_nod]
MNISAGPITMAASAPEDIGERYIDLLKQVLSFSLWDGRDGTVWRGRKGAQILRRLLEYYNLSITRMTSSEIRQNGQDWPRLAHTMVGMKRLNNLHECIDTILDDQIPGDLIETGVWRGGSCILMRGILAARGITDRRVWVADSFSGLPVPDPERYPADAGDGHHTVSDLVVPLVEVKENFRRYGLLDAQVSFLPGWFSETLPGAPIERLALMRLDGDMYSSTIEALTALYPKLSEGGFCIIDDYGAVEGCRSAVEDFRSANGIDAPITRIDTCGAFWRR